MTQTTPTTVTVTATYTVTTPDDVVHSEAVYVMDKQGVTERISRRYDEGGPRAYMADRWEDEDPYHVYVPVHREDGRATWMNLGEMMKGVDRWKAHRAVVAAVLNAPERPWQLNG